MKNSFFKISIASIFSLLILSSGIMAQNNDKPRPSLMAGVSQRIGVDTDITISYSRPGVKERKIWGELVPWGLAPGNKYSNDKPFPWRGGANENTTIEFSKDVLIDGHKLSAGKYGMHFIPGKDKWTVIFSKNSELWGSYQYNQEEDALRIEVEPQEAPFAEWLTYGFDKLAGTSCTAYLHWEKLRVSFSVSIDDAM